MMNYKLILLYCFGIFSLEGQDKHVLGTRGCGFFADFLGIINNLDWCERNNKTPVVYWNTKCLYHEKKLYRDTWNAWEYYFYPVSDQTYTQKDKVYNTFAAPDGSTLVTMFCKNILQIRYRVHELIVKYIKVLPYVQEIINNFYDNNMKGKITIGIHMRSTDKNAEIKQTPPEKIIEAANNFAKTNYPEGSYQFLVATDEQRLLDLAKKTLCGPVVYYDAIRSQNNKPIHTNNSQHARAGLDVLVEALLLSLTDVFVHTSSSVSSSVLAFNTKFINIPLGPGFKNYSDHEITFYVQEN